LRQRFLKLGGVPLGVVAAAASGGAAACPARMARQARRFMSCSSSPNPCGESRAPSNLAGFGAGAMVMLDHQETSCRSRLYGNAGLKYFARIGAAGSRFTCLP